MPVEPVTFTYMLPFIQTFLANRGLTEYHVVISATSEFKQAFKENTQTPFIEAVNNFVSTAYNKDIFYQDKSEEYIFLHFKTEVAENIVKRIVNDLQKQYESEWIKHRVPSLFSTTMHRLQEPQFLALSVCHFQQHNGFEDTQTIIDIYFDHLQNLKT